MDKRPQAPEVATPETQYRDLFLEELSAMSTHGRQVILGRMNPGGDLGKISDDPDLLKGFVQSIQDTGREEQLRHEIEHADRMEAWVRNMFEAATPEVNHYIEE